MNAERKHSHYHKDVSHLQTIDVYRLFTLYEVTDPCIQHSIKKLLVAGGRGGKSKAKDVQEAIDTMQRWQEMQAEDLRMGNIVRNGGDPHYADMEALSGEAFDDFTPQAAV